MRTVAEIFEKLCEIAPLSLQLPFDNAGFQLGRSDAAVDCVLLSLDITDEVVEEALEKKVQLIISHHPLIWEAPKSITDLDPARIKLLRLLENSIAVISMHTNLDIAEGGVNDVLIGLLGASNEGRFETDGCGRMGRMSTPMPLDLFLSLCKEKLCANGLRYYDAGKPVDHIAVFGGAGSGSLDEAAANGCDTLVTSDVKYHVFLHARELKINLIDADHFCTENPVMPVLTQKLRDAFPDCVFRLSERHAQTARFF